VLTCPSGETIEGDALLVATGRRPNGDRMDVARTGLQLTRDGRIEVDEYQRTSVEGIWALGDVSSPYQLKHVANHEARVVQHNLLHPDALRATSHRFVPSAVFTHPQVASVGQREQDLRDSATPYVAKVQAYGDVAFGWAMEDTTGFVKVLAAPDGTLLGAHFLGPQASSLIQVLVQAMVFGQKAQEVAHGQYWIHPALPELIENALLGLPLGS
jgi:mycothione reductase